MKLLTAVVRDDGVSAADRDENRWVSLKSPLAFGEVPLKAFQRMFQKVRDREVGKEDITVPFADIKFVDDVGAIDIRSYGRVFMSELAFSQLCARLKVPTDYMVRCPLSLRNANMSYWVEQNDERKVMLRIRKFPESDQDKEGIGVLRAVLPSSYEPIDNPRIVDWIAAAVEQHAGELGIQHARIGEVSTHVRLIFKHSVSINEDMDHPFHFGVHVSDSEVGERGFCTDFISFRPNHEAGFLHLIEGAHLVWQRHIHIDFKLLRRDFAESFAVAKESQESVSELLTGAAVSLVRDPHSYIRRLMRHHRLTNDFAETVIHAYEAEPVATKLGIALAISRASKRMPIDMRVDTEALVGNYLLEGV